MSTKKVRSVGDLYLDLHRALNNKADDVISEDNRIRVAEYLGNIRLSENLSMIMMYIRELASNNFYLPGKNKKETYERESVLTD